MPTSGASGGFFSGDYGYIVPKNNGKVVRFSLITFAVEVLDLPTIANDADLRGFSGGFASGDYGYVVPLDNAVASGKVVRFDLEIGRAHV